MSCGCEESRPRNGANKNDGRWWRNFCSPVNPDAENGRSHGQDGFERQNRETLGRHLRESGDEPSLMVYSVMDFPGVGDDKASSSSDAPRRARAVHLPSNTEKGVPIITENFEGETLIMLRRAPGYHNPEDRNYNHFNKRKRLWEFRIQGKFKRRPEGELHVGVVLRDFNYDQAVAGSSVMVKKMAMMLVKYETYMHWGDRCEESRLPDAELSHMVTNMTGWDQIIVTPAGEEPPRLEGSLQGLGLERKEKGLKEYSKSCKSVLEEIDLESTYTFCFWGVSQLLDVLHWKFLFGLGAKFSMNQFFEEWPIHACMYELDPKKITKEDGRHLESRKRYYVDILLWAATVDDVTENPALCDTYHFLDPAPTLDALRKSAKAALDSSKSGFFGRLATGKTNGKAKSNSSQINGRTKNTSSHSEDDGFISCDSDDDKKKPKKSWFGCCSRASKSSKTRRRRRSR